MAFEPTAQVEGHLVNDLVVWLTTVTPSGRPAPRPVWFMWEEWYDSYNTAIRVTPERVWTIPA